MAKETKSRLKELFELFKDKPGILIFAGARSSRSNACRKGSGAGTGKKSSNGWSRD
jgi:hypothetical protein